MRTNRLEGLLSLHQDQEEEEEGGLKNLQKRWFDNMKDYLERKEARIAAQQRQQQQLAETAAQLQQKQQQQLAETAEPPEKRNKLETC